MKLREESKMMSKAGIVTTKLGTTAGEFFWWKKRRNLGFVLISLR